MKLRLAARACPLLWIACACVSEPISEPVSVAAASTPEAAPDAGALDESEAVAQPPRADSGAWSQAPWPSGEWSGCRSNAGTYWIEWRPLGEAVQAGELPLNEDFSLELRLFDDATRALRPEAVELDVSARMPTHGHGMKQDTHVECLPDGSLLVSGMLLHMTGPWELYFDIRRGAYTERAQVAYELE